MSVSPASSEKRATEYSKAATRGNWNEVWESFGERKKAKAEPAATDALDEGAEAGVFGDVRVAAE